MKQIWQTEAWPRFSYDSQSTELLLGQALESIGEIQGLLAGFDPDDQEQLRFGQLVQEALSSFSIEGVALNAAEIEASVIASLRNRNMAPPSRRSDAIAELMIEARQADEPLEAERLFQWHRLLFFGIELEDLGRWRSFDLEIVRSANAGQHEVLYKAPPPERLDAEMARFLTWLRAPKAQHPAITAAIAHLWFESIHPFSDGNGRIGRALIEHIFAQHRALPFSLSRQIEREKKAYYAALQAGRRVLGDAIDATPFILWFLNCLLSAALNSREEAYFLTRRNAFFLRHGADLGPRQEKAFRLLFGQGAARLEEGLTARSWRKLTGASAATATRDLAALQELGILKPLGAGGRSTRYEICL